MLGIVTNRAVIGFLTEFLYLSRKTDLDRIVFVYLLENGFKYRVFLGGKKRGIRKIYTKLLCSEKCVIVVKVCKGLRVGSTVRVIPNSVNVNLWRVAVLNEIIAILVKLNAFRYVFSRTDKNAVYLLKNNGVFSVFVIFPEYLSHKSEVSCGFAARVSVRINMVSEYPAVSAVLVVSVGIVIIDNSVSKLLSLLHISRVVINV